MKRAMSEVQSKIAEISDYGYTNIFSFKRGQFLFEKELDEQKTVQSYVAQQISVEAEYVYEETGAAVITFMTNDGILGYTIDKADPSGEFPILNYLESFED